MQLVSTAKTATSATSAANLSSCPLDRGGPERRDSRSRLCDEQTPFAFHFHDERLRLDFDHAVAPAHVQRRARHERRFAPDLAGDHEAASLIHGRNHGANSTIESAIPARREETPAGSL